jgi:hypothetical protein
VSSATLDRIAAMDAAFRRYCVNYMVAEAIAGNDWELLAQVLTDPGFLQARATQTGAVDRGH